jgi:hypothetical protein
MRYSRRSFAILTCAAVFTGAMFVDGAPAWAVPGLVAVTVTSAETGSEPFKGALAVCPPRTNIVGGGADILGGGHGVHLAGINPAPLGYPPNSLWATANDDVSGYAGSWSIRSWAICAPGLNSWEMVQVSKFEPLGSPLAVATASCPAGKKVIGAGGRSEGKPSVILDSINIASDLSSVTVEVAAINGAAPHAYAYAMCVTPVPGQQLIHVSGPFDSADKTLTINCPKGTSLHGVGGGLTYALGQSYIDELGPTGVSLSSAHLDVREDADGNPNNWMADLYAICAT